MRIAVSWPFPAVRVEIRCEPAVTFWRRRSGWRPLGNRKKPSKATARSRLPRAHSNRERKASSPERAPSRSASQVIVSVPITVSAARFGEAVTSQLFESSSTAQLNPRSSSSIL